MRFKFSLSNLPIILSTLALLLTIPLLIWGVSQRQEIRKKAAEPPNFPQVDLNGDGIINNVDLRIYYEVTRPNGSDLEKFAPSPSPQK